MSIKQTKPLPPSFQVPEPHKIMSPHLATLDEMFGANAITFGDDNALKDAIDHRCSELKSINNISYKQASNLINHTAALFQRFGLKPGDLVAVQMPNCATLPLLILSLMRAGLVPCFIPPLWRTSELSDSFPTLNIRAIISVANDQQEAITATIFEIARADISIRFIFGLGFDLPDGVTPLTTFNDYQNLHHPAELTPHNRGLDHGAFISFSINADGQSVPLIFTHKQLMILAGLHLELSHLKPQPKILTSYALTTLTGLIGCFVPWILRGGELTLFADVTVQSLANITKDTSFDYAVLPSGTINAWLQSDQNTNNITSYGAVWPAPCRPREDEAVMTTDKPICDLYLINGYTLIAAARGNGEQPGELLMEIPFKGGALSKGDVILKGGVNSEGKNNAAECCKYL